MWYRDWHLPVKPFKLLNSSMPQFPHPPNWNDLKFYLRSLPHKVVRKIKLNYSVKMLWKYFSSAMYVEGVIIIVIQIDKQVIVTFLLLEKKQVGSSTWVWSKYIGLWPYGRASVSCLYFWRKLSLCPSLNVICLQKFAPKPTVLGAKRPTAVWETAFDGRWVYDFCICHRS